MALDICLGKKNEILKKTPYFIIRSKCMQSVIKITINLYLVCSPSSQIYKSKKINKYLNMACKFILCVFLGSGGISTRWEERTGEHETGSGEADQNAGIRPQTRKVKKTCRASHLFFFLPCCVHLWFAGCRRTDLFRCPYATSHALQIQVSEAEDWQRAESRRQKGRDGGRSGYVSEMQNFSRVSPSVVSPLNCPFPVVPNGPAESDSEPANQMSWKEGRQLLRK